MAEPTVVVVGANLAGSAAATLLARAGAKVTLLEKSPDPAHYKRVCGHYIQASGVPVLERLGLMDEVMAAGAVRSHSRLRTPFGWHAEFGDERVPRCLNLRREKLDPIVRRQAERTSGVELRLGAAVTGLVRDGERIAGVELRDGTVLHADLVVGADGRDSALAKLAGVREEVVAVDRFGYGAYYEGPAPSAAPDGQLWFLNPGWAAAFPTDDGLTQYAVLLDKKLLPEFKQDLEGAFERFIAGLPDAPPIAESTRVGQMLGRIELDNRRRGPVADGFALVGDAALAADPLWGVGCGWALESAERLAVAVTPWLAGRGSLDRGLRRYKRASDRRLRIHMQMIDGYGANRRFNGMERKLHVAAARDAKVAEAMAFVGTRIKSPVSVMRPGTAVRIWRANRAAARERGREGYSSTTSTSPSLTA